MSSAEVDDPITSDSELNAWELIRTKTVSDSEGRLFGLQEGGYGFFYFHPQIISTPAGLLLGSKLKTAVGVGKISFVEVGDDKDCTLPQPHMKFSK
jgi:hypothetical protein